MQINKIHFRERPGYQRMRARSFDSNPSREDVQIIAEATEHGENLESSALARVARHALNTSSKAGAEISIANGWAERRLTFSMDVLVRDSRSAATVLEISGHTDYVGVSTLDGRNIKLDRNMRLYFNNITEIKHALIDIPRVGRGWRTTIANSSHVITPYVKPDFSRDRVTPGTMTMRPEDIFHSKPKDVLSRSFEDRVRQDGRFADFRQSVSTQGIVLSDRRNDSTATFLKRSLRALSASQNDVFERDGIEMDQTKIFRDTRNNLREQVFTSWAPMVDLARDSRIMDNGFITLGELMDLNPDYPWRDVEVSLLPPEQRNDYSGSTRDWGGRDYTSIAATHLARALPAYMIYHQIGSYITDVNNQGYGGEVTFLTTQAMTLDVYDRITNDRLDAFEQRLRTELFEEILPWEGCPFTLDLRAELGRDVQMTISVAGEDVSEFVYPLFADSPSAPIVVEDHNIITSLGSTMSGIVDMFGDELSIENPLHAPIRRGSPSF